MGLCRVFRFMRVHLAILMLRTYALWGAGRSILITLVLLGLVSWSHDFSQPSFLPNFRSSARLSRELSLPS